MRLGPLLLAASVLAAVPSPSSAGGQKTASKQARTATGTGTHTYLTPVMEHRQIVGFQRSAKRPRGVVRGLRNALRVTFGRKAPSRALPDTTLSIPGHTLNWRSLRPAMKHFMTNKANGTVAAVYVAKTGTFHANRPRGRVLSDAEVKATKLVTVEFSNAKAGAEIKSVEIASAVRALRRAKGGEGRMSLRVVRHSAGAPQFDAALLDHIDPIRDGVKITARVSVGGIPSAGAWTGNVGATPAGLLLGMRQAASELAEGSPFLARLDANRAAIDAKVEGPTVDIALEGAPTPRLKGRPGVGNGDGFVQSRDVGRPHGQTLVLRGINPLPTNHLFQIRYPGAIKAIEEVLTAE